jgi:hypothetical protein
MLLKKFEEQPSNSLSWPLEIDVILLASWPVL